MKTPRLYSLDALRGFDMFWIAGGAGIIHSLSHATDSKILDWLSYQLLHSEWDGFRFCDVIFPLFLFISGVTLPFSFENRKQKGQGRAEVYRHIVTRALLLIVFGFIYNGLFKADFENMRYASVLGRIGIAWMLAACIAYHFSTRSQIIWFWGILIFYWAMMMLVPVPGFGAGVLTQEGNLSGYIDRLILPGKLYYGDMDPEGIFSTIPSGSTALLGAITGAFLKHQDPGMRWNGLQKGLSLVGVGIAFMILGWVWGLSFPINKSLWSSSFVLFAGGFSLTLLALFYLLIDVYGFRNWAFGFMIIGVNPITIYMAQHGIIDFWITTDFFLSGFSRYVSESLYEVIRSSGWFAVSWLFLFFLYRQKIFLKM